MLRKNGGVKFVNFLDLFVNLFLDHARMASSAKLLTFCCCKQMLQFCKTFESKTLKSFFLI